MAEFSKQYCERHMPEEQWDFDIDEIANNLENGYYEPYICEGYGFCYIRKNEDGNIFLGFRNYETNKVEWKSYTDVVAPTKIRFDDVVILNGKLNADGDVILFNDVLNIPEEVPVYSEFDVLNKNHIGVAKLRHEGNSIKADIIVDRLIDGYPCISVRLDEFKDGVVTKMNLIGVSICVNPNADSTIKTIQEQIEENRK